MGVIKDTEANIPLTETTFYILLSLANEPRHGYKIMKDVNELSENRILFSTGTLYGALRRLLQKGWIERVTGEQSEQLNDERNRKFYALTHLGKQVLNAEVHRLRKLVQLAGLRQSEILP
jgi:DNA-binding PadR family transcriptional regulator